MMRSSDCPTASAALWPKIRSAPGFQKRMRPSRSLATTASAGAARIARPISSSANVVPVAIPRPPGFQRLPRPHDMGRSFGGWVELSTNRILVVIRVNGLPILSLGGKPEKLPLHRIDLGEIGRHGMIAAALAHQRTKAAAHEIFRRTGAAQMDQGGEVLLLLRCRRDAGQAGEHWRDTAVQVDRRKLDGVARQDANIEAGEPAAVLDDRVLADAIAPRLGESRIGHLVHADRARG